MKNFKLIGHDCPYGSYPAPVVAIGELNGRRVAVYPGGTPGPTIERVDPGAFFVLHSPLLNEKLAGFDYLTERLFAYSETEVEAYAISDEKQFFQNFLSTFKYRDADTSIRRMLTSYIEDAAPAAR